MSTAYRALGRTTVITDITGFYPTKSIWFTFTILHVHVICGYYCTATTLVWILKTAMYTHIILPSLGLFMLGRDCVVCIPPLLWALSCRRQYIIQCGRYRVIFVWSRFNPDHQYRSRTQLLINPSGLLHIGFSWYLYSTP